MNISSVRRYPWGDTKLYHVTYKSGLTKTYHGWSVPNTVIKFIATAPIRTKCFDSGLRISGTEYRHEAETNRLMKLLEEVAKGHEKYAETLLDDHSFWVAYENLKKAVTKL